MTSVWEDTFRNRMDKFGSKHSVGSDDVPMSIKVRVTSGCFHRDHSPHAYEIIDDYLRDISPEQYDFAFEEHESGPEILVYLALASSLVTLSANVINLVTVIIKARSESVKKGDNPHAPVELIVRRVIKSGEIREEEVLRIGHDDPIDSKEIARKLNAATQKLFSDSKKKKRGK